MDKLNLKKIFHFYLFWMLFCTINGFPAGSLVITTWNIEHLGSPGRGLGGIGETRLPFRTPVQLDSIAKFIKKNIKSDLLCLQEVAIPECKHAFFPLDSIAKSLGTNWKYKLGSPGAPFNHQNSTHNMVCAFLWNTNKVRLLKSFNLPFPNEEVGQKNLYDRRPLFGYFEALKNGQPKNDFLLVNTHLASGQDNDENHIAAMVIIEQSINRLIKANKIKESDRIILGDFNDNPFRLNRKGEPAYLGAMYRYMEKKKYQDLVKPDIQYTRMDDSLKSIIDHILVNSSAKHHLIDSTVMKLSPPKNRMAVWRKTYSDHFPLSIRLKVGRDDDVDW